VTLVEPDSLWILLVHIDQQPRILGPRVGQQDRARATTTVLVVDEQHLQVATGNTREADRHTVGIRDREVDHLQVLLGQPPLVEIDVAGSQEVMRRFDRTTPDL